MSHCRRCLTEKTTLTAAQDEIRRLARLLARTTHPKKVAAYKEQLALAKANRAKANDEIIRGHECDNKLSEEHWTRRA